MPFATAQDMLDRTDARWLGNLVFDDGTRATPTQFLASGRVAACLADASGLVLASALQGERYSKDDLAGLTGDGLSLLVRITVDLASAMLAEASQVPVADIEKSVPGYARAMQFLEQLRNGDVIFDVVAAARAGNTDLALQTRSGIIVRDMASYFGDVWWTDQRIDDGTGSGPC